MTEKNHRRLPLTRHAHDRQAELRPNPDLIPTLLADSSTNIVVLSQGKALVENSALARFSPEDLSEQLQHEHTRIVFLGSDEHRTSYLAAVLTAEISDSLSTAAQFEDLKQVGHLLSEIDAGLYTQALAVTNWHRSYQYSPQRGQKVVHSHGGWVLHPEDTPEHQVFPRTDAAVIVLVTDDQDRILLGNNAQWENNRYSLLAGFVEPGESLEAAVVREVMEESGLLVAEPTYFASQPWPFPQSLMIGFTAVLAAGQNPSELRADGEEILHLRWFTREELIASLNDIALPGPVAIARVMIEHWLGEPLEVHVPW